MDDEDIHRFRGQEKVAGVALGAAAGEITPRKMVNPVSLCANREFSTEWHLAAITRNQVRRLLTEANKLCDDYGFDTFVIQPMINWLIRCYKAGILSDSNTGLPLSKMGSGEFIESLTKKIAIRDGFGDVLARGLDKAAEFVGKGAKELLEGQISKAGEAMWYEPRLYITTSFFYAMEPRRSIHLVHELAEPVGMWLLCMVMKQGYYSTDVLRRIGKRFYGTELAFDFSTYEGKALSRKEGPRSGICQREPDTL